MKDQMPDAALELANSILIEMGQKKVDPVLCYAALGCAFIQLHKGLQKNKEEWISLTKEMSEICWKSK